MADLTSFLVGVVAGFIVGAIVFTPTGREITRAVTVPTARAVGRRVEYHIEPR
jgi:hypothetical protein